MHRVSDTTYLQVVNSRLIGSGKCATEALLYVTSNIHQSEDLWGIYTEPCAVALRVLVGRASATLSLKQVY
jgi:hypothetical protein